MPQSWPSQWVMLFIYFSLIILTMVILNFFIMGNSVQQHKMELNKTSLYAWQW